MGNKFYVYIIQNQKNNLIYIGYTGNLAQRVFQHNSNLSRYTKLKGPWKLVWYGVFFDKEQAKQFERYLKSHSGRVFIKKRLLASGEAIA